MVPGCEPLDDGARAIVRERCEARGDPLLEAVDALVAAFRQHAVMHEQCLQVPGRGTRAELVECLMGERQLAGADGGEQFMGLLTKHVRVCALRAVDVGEYVDESAQPEVGAGTEEIVQVGLNDAADAVFAADPFGLASAFLT